CYLFRVQRALRPSSTVVSVFSLLVSLSGVACSSSSSSNGASDTGGDTGASCTPAPESQPAWLSDARILACGHHDKQPDCRDGGICQHNENVDAIAWNGALWIVHRPAMSQVLGPNSALHVYKSTDGGQTFVDVATIPAPITSLGPEDKATAGRD